MIEFPRRNLVSLQELAARVIDRREQGCDGETLARDLLGGFFEACTRAGLDRVLVELATAFPPLDLTDPFALAEHAALRAALVEKLGHKPAFDDGGPRNAKPRQLAECLVATLTLTLTDDPDRPITLTDDLRAKVAAAIASVIDLEFAMPQIRDNIIAQARKRLDERHHGAFDKIAAQLDERGMRMIRQPKVPLDAVQAVQAALFETRNAIVERAARVAIDRAKQVLAGSNTDAAARIDLPITHRLTPRDVAILRACEARVPKTPAGVAHSLFDSLTELVQLVWSAPERPVRVYAPSQTFAVGDLLEHPKFGRGAVKSCAAQRIEVEFEAGPVTLVHAK